MKELGRAIRSAREDRITCDVCEAMLAEYVNAQVMGNEPLSDFDQVAWHVQVCPHCAQEYQELKALVKAAYTGALPAPEEKPGFNFSFLGQEQKAPEWQAPEKRTPSWRMELGCLMIRLADHLAEFWSQPRSELAQQVLKSEGERGILGQLSLEVPIEDLEVTITAEGQRDTATLCKVIVAVNIPSRGGWPHLSESEVTLHRVTGEAQVQVTDAYGQAIFENISITGLPQLTFVIAPHR